MLPFIIAGITTGSIFALAGVGLVLSYKTSGIFNFAHGALASISAFLFYTLHVQDGMAWPLAAAICVAGAGPVLGLLLELLARRLAGRPLPIQVAATVGLGLAIQGAISILYPPSQARSVPQFLPTSSVSIDGTAVQLYRVIIFAVVLLAVAGLTVFLRVSRVGTAMRAVVDDPDLLDISGTSPVRVRRTAWLISSCAVSASGLLLVPLLPLDVTTFTLLVVTAFGAAAIGAFNNLLLTYLGALAIGIGQALLQKYFISSTGVAGGLSAALPFLILFALLIAAPRLRRPAAGLRPRLLPEQWQAPAPLRLGIAVAGVAFLALVPSFASYQLGAWTEFLAYILVFLSLGLLVRLSGQVSLAQVSFMAIGVVTLSHLTVNAHWPWGLALLAAGVIAAPVGAVLAIPAIRFPGLYLALATLGFGVLLQFMFYGQDYMFGTLNAGLTVLRPHLNGLDLGSDNGYYYLVLVIVVAAALLVVAINRSRVGRLLRALSDSPAGLAACGTSVNVSRVLVFSLSAALAAIAGALDAGALGFVGPDNYQPITSLQLFVLVMITAGGLPWYAAIAAFGQVLAPVYLNLGPEVSNYLTLLFGFGAVQYAVVTEQPAYVRRLQARLASASRRRARPAASVPVAALADAAVPAIRGRLDAQDITVRYGGLVAADAITLTVGTGAITGLIGPNGAGKSTVFNAVAGAVRPARGSVRLDGRSLGRLPAPARARRGLGRTFQRMELFDSLTVEQNVALGSEGHYAGWNPLGHLFALPRQRAAVAVDTERALDLCGLAGLRTRTAGSLSTGQRRLVELARCLAGPFHILLLDEPSSGLDRTETQRFGDILKRVVSERGVGILLVEHDMALVNRLCQQVYVLDFGRQIFQGTVAEVGASPLVRSAYLGSDGLPGQATGAAK